MRRPAARWWTLAAVWLLAACASTQPALMSSGEGTATSAGCDAPGDDKCVVLACDEGLCGFFDCGDVLASTSTELDVRPALARPPGLLMGGPRPGRWWRRAPWLRGGAEPVMTFRMYPERPLPPAQPALPAPRMQKHHLFPQAPTLAQWFRDRGINIHDYTMRIPEHVHRRIHGGGPSGGMWNEAWRQFIDGPGKTASTEQIFQHVGVLIYRFELAGPVMPYYRKY